MNIEKHNQTFGEESVHLTRHNSENIETSVKCVNCLPEGYNYIILEEQYVNDSNFEVEFRCNIQTAEEAKQWLERLSEKSFVTWRVGKTHPDTGRYNIFKIEYRCKHRGAHKIKEGSTRKSHNTRCPGWLTITIKRYIQKSRSKVALKDHYDASKEHPCVIRLKNIHNHEIGTCESLRLRDVSKEVKEKLRQLYKEGYTPTTAFQKLHRDAMLQYGAEYNKISTDRRFCPNKAFCYDLYYAEFQKRCKKPVPVDDQFIIEDVEYANIQLETTVDNNSENVLIKVIPISLQKEIPDDTVIVFKDQYNDIEISETEKLSSDLEKCLNEMYQRFMNPPLTVEKISAVKEFLHNYTTFVQTEDDFLLAARNYGRINDNFNVKRKLSVNGSDDGFQSKRRIKATNETDDLDRVIIGTKDIHCYSQTIVE